MGNAAISWSVWLVGIIGIVTIVLGAIFDTRFLIVGLIICLTIMPMLAFFIYFSNILDSHIMLNVLPHTIESKPGGYLVRIYREDRHDDCDGNEVKEWVETGRMTIFDFKVKKRVEKDDYSLLYLVDSPVKVLYIPKGLQPLPQCCGLNRKVNDENS